MAGARRREYNKSGNLIMEAGTENMKIAIGNDHTAVGLKTWIKAHLLEAGHEVVDFGTNGEERTDYPVYGYKAAKAVAAGECRFGVLICGTGVGISLAANKVRGIRAAVCSEPYTAMLSRRHNDANIVDFGARVVGPAIAEMIVDCFIGEKYEGGRHQRRIDMLSAIEEDKFDV